MAENSSVIYCALLRDGSFNATEAFETVHGPAKWKLAASSRDLNRRTIRHHGRHVFMPRVSCRAVHDGARPAGLKFSPRLARG